MRRGEGSSSSSNTGVAVPEYDLNHHIAPRLPLFAIRSVVNEDDAKMMFEKTLDCGDVNCRQNFLVLKSEEMVLWALKQEERSKLAREGFLEVPTLDPSGNGYNMRLQRRPSTRTAAMSDEWYKLVETNGLKIGDKVQGWAVRGEDGRLRCILTLMLRLN
ncbi:B3 domain-containing protein At1g05920-like [Salvia splendens]|uniref:B3 domain-containing protein At1g05920-like n=1 Tax=Salvia splendens TaxID=180675 RepID=UPI001C266D07|nr:B3 domain-containing protein At1g05920-like [Salvia splendens]